MGWLHPRHVRVRFAALAFLMVCTRGIVCLLSCWCGVAPYQLPRLAARVARLVGGLPKPSHLCALHHLHHTRLPVEVVLAFGLVVGVGDGVAFVACPYHVARAPALIPSAGPYRHV